ncbi:hypothetical protein E2562_013103 [Oryza meyeriana var. granulata]|uniref:Uncharacterized protein n=1 Tax=Oryza meyeriana var. granulata TaxID=110450 RepID=A0A6G1F7S3_9ORYZ|nr:hypothetical protein E2562_013103 [Oryza meyeriana var. granulata]
MICDPVVGGGSILVIGPLGKQKLAIEIPPSARRVLPAVKPPMDPEDEELLRDDELANFMGHFQWLTCPRKTFN